MGYLKKIGNLLKKNEEQTILTKEIDCFIEIEKK
jgi:hypothetical protein